MASNENTPERILNAPAQKVVQIPVLGQLIRKNPRRGKKVKRHAKNS